MTFKIQTIHMLSYQYIQHTIAMLKHLVLLLQLELAVGLTVWPKPQHATAPGPELSISASFAFQATGVDSDILQDAMTRYLGITFKFSSSMKTSQNAFAEIVGCDIDVKNADGSLDLDTDESYVLDIKAPRVTISANTVYGAMRGMESFSQLVDTTRLVNQTTITDSPRFHFRAFMIDTSRHFYPVEVIMQHLDAMSYSKMNVLHWHLVDSVSFPFESTTFPSMAITGAYSSSHKYTHDDIRRVTDYAAKRGIRVLPEFDSPGHVEAGYTGIPEYPDLLTECYGADGKPTGETGPLRPDLDSTYEFLTKFYAEIKSLFPDKFIHVGGDEVPFDCWQSNPEITKFMKAHPEIKDYAALEQYYELRLLEILQKQNTSYGCWEEIFDNGVKILADTIVYVWKAGGDATLGTNSWNQTISKVTSAGYHAVLSAPFYLNYISYGVDWKKYYQVEPTHFDGTDEQKKLVGGVEVCMWSEFVDATNFISRSWPRASAVAERGWSSEDVTDLADASARLHELRCKLISRGIPAEPIVNGGRPGEEGSESVTQWCNTEWSPTYRTPWSS